VINEDKLQDKINWKPHKNQKEILDKDKRNVVICAGRRFGKSMLCAYMIVKQVLESDKFRRKDMIWIVAPTYDLAGKVFDYVAPWLYKIYGTSAFKYSNRPPQYIETKAGTKIRCKSATEPNSLLGESVDLLIVDECSRIGRNVYEVYLDAVTVDNPKSKTFYISTPFGKNWFYEYWMRADKPEEKDMVAFHFQSRDNPTLPKGFWEERKRRLPTDVFSQEYAAEFLEGAGTVFRGLRDIIDEDLNGGLPYEPGHQYYMGLDLAKIRDFTVAVVVDRMTHQVVAIDRFQKISYPMQKDRIIKLANAYKAKVIVESNNIGASMGDDLRSYGLKIHDFKTVGTISKDWKKKGSKERIIEKLAETIEDKNITIPRHKQLLNELESFSYILSDAGNFKYAAPTGLHDDCVDALAMAVWMLHGKQKEENIRAQKAIRPFRKKQFQYY